MFDVVGIGLNAIDYLVRLPRFPVPGEKLRMSAFTREGGGQAATALVALSRWGCRCKYVGNVGDDEHGRLSSLLLSREGVDLAHVRTVPGASSQFAVILVEEGTGERTILWDRDPRIRVTPEDLPLDEIRRARALLLDGHDVPPAIAAARAARTAGVPVVLDAEKVQEGTEELLSLCDHIVAAGHFPGSLIPGASPEDGAREILRRYAPRTSTVTLGPRGAFGCDGREEVFSPSIRVDAMDTTGAGDIFHAGFLYALLGGLPFREILAFANAAAGLSCRGMGGRAAIPTMEAIREAGASRNPPGRPFPIRQDATPGRFRARSIAAPGMVEWAYLDQPEEADMAIEKTIRKKIGAVEGQLARRVGSLEKDVTRLMKKLEKKENEVRKLKDKLTSRLVKNVKKKVKKATKAVKKRLPGIG